MYPNVLWDFPLKKTYYLSHPFKFFKEIRSNIRHAWQRITKGYCNADWWNMNDWMVAVLPKMFRDMADKGYGCTMKEPFNGDFEKWKSWLYKLAYDLESCSEDAQNKRNEYYEPYMKFVLTNSEKYSAEQKEIFRKYLNRSEQLWKESEDTVKEVFAEIGKHFFDLWD